MALPDGIDPNRFDRLLDLAREEDWGSTGDMTTALFADRNLTEGRWRVVARADGRAAGVALISHILARLAPEVSVTAGLDGVDVRRGTVIAELAGPVLQMLPIERIVLNILTRLSGIATLTQSFVKRIEGTTALIYDTRKTTPGWRDLERYAVRLGGGRNHRHGLHDAVLIKDNHLAGIATDRLANSVFERLNGLDRLPVQPAFVEVEADSLDQLRELFKIVGINVILLDNFSLDELVEAVRCRDELGLRGRVALEASGGIRLENVRAVAETGVERIAVGAITHSAVALDVGLDAVS